MSGDRDAFSGASDRVVARLTSAGRSAVAVIGVRGPGAANAVALCFRAATSSPLRANQIRYGVWSRSDAPEASAFDDPGESLVVVPLGDDQFEIHCHGGSAATKRIMTDLCSLGFRKVDGFEFAEPEDEFVRVAHQVLAACTTRTTAAYALDQLRGALRDWFRNPARRQQTSADDLIRYSRVSLRLTQPICVALIGPPNVGKSTLTNALVGFDRSITSAAAGTTRDVLQADTVLEGWPVRFLDMAGIRQTDEAIEAEGVRRARRGADQADVVLTVQDSAEPFLQQPNWQRLIRVQNKIDQCPQGDFVNGIQAVSALTGEGLEELHKAIVGVWLEDFPPPGIGVPLVLNQTQLDRVLLHR